MRDLRALRKQAGLQVKDILATYSDKRMDKYLYSKIERGIIAPTPELENHVVSMCEAAIEQIQGKVDTNTETSVATAEKTVLPYIAVGRENAITRGKLAGITGLSDRNLREQIGQLRRKYPIVNRQDGSGYYISNDPGELKRYLEQETARAKSIFWSMRGAREKLREMESRYGKRRAEN